MNETSLGIALALNEGTGKTKLSRDGVVEFFRAIREILFFDAYARGEKKERIPILLREAETEFKRFASGEGGNQSSFDSFIECLPEIKRLLISDAEAIYEGDPAALSVDEVILSYPGFFAIMAYRLAHALLLMGYPFAARVLSEYAHSRTGIDINPGAEIGSSFFIDHGTGIVIGETAKIGSHVKIYQGVTLGALSLRDGRKLEGKKRHPTVLDGVTIYSGASIFGGETVIGEGATIGSNAYIVSSIPPHAVVRVKPFDMEIRSKD